MSHQFLSGMFLIGPLKIALSESEIVAIEYEVEKIHKVFAEFEGGVIDELPEKYRKLDDVCEYIAYRLEPRIVRSAIDYWNSNGGDDPMVAFRIIGRKGKKKVAFLGGTCDDNGEGGYDGEGFQQFETLDAFGLLPRFGLS